MIELSETLSTSYNCDDSEVRLPQSGEEITLKELRTNIVTTRLVIDIDVNKRNPSIYDFSTIYIPILFEKTRNKIKKLIKENRMSSDTIQKISDYYDKSNDKEALDNFWMARKDFFYTKKRGLTDEGLNKFKIIYEIE